MATPSSLNLLEEIRAYSHHLIVFGCFAPLEIQLWRNPRRIGTVPEEGMHQKRANCFKNLPAAIEKADATLLFWNPRNDKPPAFAGYIGSHGLLPVLQKCAPALPLVTRVDEKNWAVYQTETMHALLDDVALTHPTVAQNIAAHMRFPFPTRLAEKPRPAHAILVR